MSEEQAVGILLPTDPEARQKIKIAVQEISNSKTRIQSEKDLIKAIVDTLSEEFELPKPTINKIADWYYKQDMNNALGKVEDASALYETIFGVEGE